MKNQQACDLEQRLIRFAARIITICDALPKNRAGTHISNQLIRSGTSPAANYAEAQGAESRADFIHKVRIALKELRETDVWLSLICEAKLIDPIEKLTPIRTESQELIAILYQSQKTAAVNGPKNR